MLKCNNELKSLDVSGTKVTDKALADIITLKKLSSLQLNDTAIGDPGARLLKNHPGIVALANSGTKITDQGFRDISTIRELEIAAHSVKLRTGLPSK